MGADWKLNGAGIYVPRDGSLAMAANLAMGGFKVTGLPAATGTGEAVRFDEASGADARVLKVRTWQVTLAQMQAKLTATNATWTMLTLAADEFLAWGWMENRGVTFTSSGALTGVYPEVGRSASPGTLIVQTNVITGGTVIDDNSQHGADFVSSAVMGNKFNTQGGDWTTYYKKSYTINVKITLTGGSQMQQLTAGGPIYIHLLLGKVDTTQVEATT